jgi:hypothetical protein
MNKSPIFIHSLFRSGSTYIFSLFRRSPKNYYSYQEPLHELTFFATQKPELLKIDHSIEKATMLRHPNIGGGYFNELLDVWPSWQQSLKEEAVYQSYFAPENKDLGLDFWKVLIDQAKARPVFQECRTSSRIHAIRQELGGHHIYLWRNPWDQWWSYKVTSYFDVVKQLIIHAPNAPEAIQLMKNALSLEAYPGQDLGGAFSFYGDRPLDSNSRYLVFYMLWCLSLREGLAHAHGLINIDRLTDSEDYRQTIQFEFASANIHNIDFSDCNVAQGFYNASEQAFFHQLESRVHGWLMGGGWSEAAIEEIQTLRKKFEPKVWSTPLPELQPTQLLAQSGRMSDVAIRYESELAKEARNRVTSQQASATITAELQTVKLDLHNVHQANHHHWSQLQESKAQEENSRNQFAQFQEQSNAQLQQAMEVAQSSQAQMQRAIEKAEQSESVLENSRNQFAQFQEQSNAQLQQALEVAQSSQAQMQWAIEKADKFEAVSEKQLSEIQDLKTLLDTNLVELQNTHQANHHHWLQLEQTRKELHDVHQANHHHWQLAEQRQNHLEMMQRSWSWRLTFPLRLAAALALRPLQTSKALGNQTLAWALNTFQKPLTQAMGWVLARPQLTNRINRWLLRWPHLHGHLLAMARRNGVLYPAPNRHTLYNQVLDDSGTASQTLAQLSPRARQIYADLKAAIDQQNKGGH